MKCNECIGEQKRVGGGGESERKTHFLERENILVAVVRMWPQKEKGGRGEERKQESELSESSKIDRDAFQKRGKNRRILLLFLLRGSIFNLPPPPLPPPLLLLLLLFSLCHSLMKIEKKCWNRKPAAPVPA